MHLLKVLVLGSSNFSSTLIELKSYLKFILLEGISKLDKNSKGKCDILFIHEEFVSPTNRDVINKKRRERRKNDPDQLNKRRAYKKKNKERILEVDRVYENRRYNSDSKYRTKKLFV